MKWMSFAVVAMSVVGGCATGSKEPVMDGVAAAAAQTPVTSANTQGQAAGTAAAGTAAPGTAAPVAASTKPVSRALIAQGYQPSTYRGQLYYCRKEKLTGSQFTHRVCLTEQEAALQERIAQDEMNKRNSVGKCVRPLCPNH